MRIIIVTLSLLISGCQTSEIFVKKDPPTDTKLMTVRNDAFSAYQKRDYKTALPLYEILTEKVSHDPELWFHLANIYARLGQPNRAVTTYERTLKLNSRHAKAWHNMGVIQLRISANTFTQMLQHTDPSHPLYPRAELFSNSLLQMMGEKKAPKPILQEQTTH